MELHPWTSLSILSLLCLHQPAALGHQSYSMPLTLPVTNPDTLPYSTDSSLDTPVSLRGANILSLSSNSFQSTNSTAVMGQDLHHYHTFFQRNTIIMLWCSMLIPVRFWGSFECQWLMNMIIIHLHGKYQNCFGSYYALRNRSHTFWNEILIYIS